MGAVRDQVPVAARGAQGVGDGVTVRRPHAVHSRPAQAASDHKKLCIHALGEAEGKPTPPHAHRVTLATSIMAQPDGDEAAAQALVRHKN
eukprot:6308490-Prymnesium_polylepis.1